MILAADVMMGHDENCAAWLRYIRRTAASSSAPTGSTDRATERAARRERRLGQPDIDPGAGSRKSSP
jgi:hypothetical protein